MGLFTDKIRIRKEDHGDKIAASIYYYKLKSPTDFLSGLMKDLLGTNQCLGIIDTSLSYKEIDVAETREELHRFLEKQNIRFREIMIKSDYTSRLMGIQIKHDDKKSISYKIGMLLTSADILALISDIKLSVQYYIGIKEEASDPEELLHRFETVKGEREDLEDCFLLKLYMDSYLSMLRITYSKDNAEAVAFILDKHIDSNK